MSEPAHLFISISNVQIYDKLCAVERDVASLKAAEAHRDREREERDRHKLIMYPTCATAAAGLVAAIVALLK